VDQAQKRFAAQASARIEITRAESGAASRLENILVSRTIIQQRERELKRIMHRSDLPLDSPTEIIPVTDPNPLGMNLLPKELVDHALANRMEMLELELRLAADAETIDFERNQALPLFTLDYQYNLSRNDRHFGDAVNLSRGGDASDWSVRLRAEIPIGNEAAKSNVQRAILLRMQRLNTREQRKLAIEQEVYDVLDELQQGWQRILAARNESILAGRTYEAEQRQFELGVRTSTDVLDASVRLATAQLREVQAVTDYEISRVDIAFATGTLLGNDRIELKT
jgi:outer membrane protein TolC